MASTWQDVALKKRTSLADAIPQEWRLKTLPSSGGSVMSVPKDSGILTADELAITESLASELVERLATGKLSSVAVTTAFCKRAALAHQVVSLTPPHSLTETSSFSFLTTYSGQLFA
jgi:amidase